MRDAFRKSALAYRRSARSFVTCAAFGELVFAVRDAVLHRIKGRCVSAGPFFTLAGRRRDLPIEDIGPPSRNA